MTINTEIWSPFKGQYGICSRINAMNASDYVCSSYNYLVNLEVLYLLQSYLNNFSLSFMRSYFGYTLEQLSTTRGPWFNLNDPQRNIDDIQICRDH